MSPTLRRRDVVCLCVCVAVCRDEVHAGNEWWAGLVHECDAGKWSRSRWKGERTGWYGLGGGYHHGSVSNGRRECVRKWCVVLTNIVIGMIVAFKGTQNTSSMIVVD